MAASRKRRVSLQSEATGAPRPCARRQASSLWRSLPPLSRRRSARRFPSSRLLRRHDGRWMWLGGDKVSVPGASADDEAPAARRLIGYRWTRIGMRRWRAMCRACCRVSPELRERHVSFDTNHQHFHDPLGSAHGGWCVSGGLRGMIPASARPTPSRPSAASTSARCMASAPSSAPAIPSDLRKRGVIGGATRSPLHQLHDRQRRAAQQTSYPQSARSSAQNWASAARPCFSSRYRRAHRHVFNTAINADGHAPGQLLELCAVVRRGLTTSPAGERRPGRRGRVRTGRIRRRPAAATALIRFERSIPAWSRRSVVRQAAPVHQGRGGRR